jgi:hypothetical protein
VSDKNSVDKENQLLASAIGGGKTRMAIDEMDEYSKTKLNKNAVDSAHLTVDWHLTYCINGCECRDKEKTEISQSLLECVEALEELSRGYCECNNAPESCICPQRKARATLGKLEGK